MQSASAIDNLANLRSNHLADRRKGLFAVCSANDHVLKTAIAWAVGSDNDLLIEATANQVNQSGGYTGMTPGAFRTYIVNLAQAGGLARQRLLLGADHLGPHIWRNEPVRQAMAKASELIRMFVEAGFDKIHLDTGIGCADDERQKLGPAPTAERAAALCRVAEETAALHPERQTAPFYVIGAEVPLPGGSLEDPDTIETTRPRDVLQTIEISESAFRSAGLESAWKRVVAIVVQPGVDFGNRRVAIYQPAKAQLLSEWHAALPGRMTYEIHSTDYQPPSVLKRLVEDHFTILKVGPAFSYAFREAVFALAQIENEWLAGGEAEKRSGIRQCLESVMVTEPQYWQAYYTGSPEDNRLLRSFSYRDRIRYYWRHKKIENALRQLFDNLGQSIPPSLISQYFPDLHGAVRSGKCRPAPQDLIRQRILRALLPYADACR